jgi:hypothetical protein
MQLNWKQQIKIFVLISLQNILIQHIILPTTILTHTQKDTQACLRRGKKSMTIYIVSEFLFMLH